MNGVLLQTVSVPGPEPLVRFNHAGQNDMVRNSNDYGYSGTSGTRIVRSTFCFPMINIESVETACQAPVVHDLLGGAPSDVPVRYVESSVFKLLPIGVPQVMLWGEHEQFVPHAFARAQVDAATRAGDRAVLLVVPGVGHFEIATTQEPSWPTLRGAVLSLLDGRLSAR